jgi:hypothetical protein
VAAILPWVTFVPAVADAETIQAGERGQEISGAVMVETPVPVRIGNPFLIADPLLR